MVFGTVKASVVNLKRRGRRNKVGTPRLKFLLAAKHLDFPGFARHQIALKCNSMRGVYERQTVYR